MAQEGRDQASGVPIEFFACEWRDGKGMSDLEKVAKKFNQWAEKRDTGYSAWILTPQFHDNLDYDVGWLGSWPDANDFGRLQDAWMKEGRDIAADFDAVADCGDVHQMATSAVVNAPDGPPSDGLVMFSRCNLLEGVTPADALAAHRELAGVMRGMGSKGMSWLFYPMLGVSTDLDYWSVLAFNSYTDLGAGLEMWTNGGGWERAASLLGPVEECAAPVVFDAKLVRSGDR
jgi:hypothetical protein